MTLSFLTPLLLIAGFLGALWLIRRYRQYYLTEYLFFVRYPLLIAVTLALLPIFGPALVPESLTNIFVMSPRAVFGTVFVACFASWSVAYTAALITASIPARCGLPWRRSDRERVQEFQEAPQSEELVRGWWRIAACALPLPTVAALVTQVESGEYLSGAVAGAAGYAAAIGVYALSAAFARRIRLDGAGEAPLYLARWPLGILHRYGDLPRSIQALHARAGRYFLLTLVVYLLIGFIGSPAAPALGGAAPWLDSWFAPLAFAYMLLAMLTWLLSLLSFQFDRGRIPAVAILLVAIAILQTVFPFRHTYNVYDWPAAVPSERTAPTVLESRWAERADGSPAGLRSAMIAASGGGITASYWTAVVLERLHAELDDLGACVDLLSAASGGGVATMYYIDAFSDAGPPGPEQLASIVERSGASSLDATAWGLAYPDLWRPAVGFLMPGIDRGWAQEAVWSDRLAQSAELGRPVRLSDWAPGVLDGWRPIHIANATLQETGQRLLLAPVPIGREPPREGVRRLDSLTWIPMRQDLFEFVPAGDIRVATAARLSATFPYVAPQAAPEVAAGVDAARAYHAADGGYYDNSGVVSILDVLLETLDGGAPQTVPERIAIIEIRAAPAADTLASSPRPANRGGLVNSTIGPLETLEKARASTQISRTGLEFELARAHWEGSRAIKVRKFVFHLSGVSPLSWSLSAAERQRIGEHWPGGPLRPASQRDAELVEARASNAEELEALIAFWRGASVQAAPRAK
ncbi:MAG: patatin-like phospholipase family protein [Phycisphaerales bacterium JB039]